MSRLTPRRGALKRSVKPALLALALAAPAAFTPAAHADDIPVGKDTIQGAYVGPIAPTSACTAEPKTSWNANTTFNPAAPVDVWDNRPSVDDIVPDRRAGANTDYCVAFRMGTNLHPGLTTSRFGTPDRPLSAGAPEHQSAFDVAPTVDANGIVPGSGDDMAGTVIDLPEGYVGAPAAVPTCSAAQFAVGNPSAVTCPENTRVGDAMVRIQLVFFDSGEDNPSPGQLVLGDNAIYNLEPGPDEVGRLGVTVQPIETVGAAKFIVRLVLAPGGRRIRTITEQLPRTVASEWNERTGAVSESWRIRVESVGLKIWGSNAAHPSMPGDFSQNTTACDVPQQADFNVTTYFGTASALQTAPHLLTGCDGLPFAPSVEVQTTEKTAATPTGLTVRLKLGQGRAGDGRLPAVLRDAAVTLPQGLELGAQAASDADGLTFCAPAQFDVATALAASTCPAATQAGTVKIASPLIDRAFTGKVYLGVPPAGQTLPDLYLEAALDGATAADAPRIKLVGRTTVDSEGRITAAFQNAPQLRFSELTLTFPGGEHALFSTPQRCGTTTGRSQVKATARTAPTPVDSALTISEGCSAPISGDVAVTPADTQAARKSATRVVITRPAAAPWFKRVAVHLPPGLLADLKTAPECAAPVASTGDCPADTRIGTLRVLAGAGAKPLPLEGKLYLTERATGDVAGAVLVTRAKIGDLDLGDVVVPGRIALRPTDAGLDFSADVPLRHKGLALQLQRIEVDLDRDSFALNPSACGPLVVSADLTGDRDEQATATSSVTYTGCGALPFRPSLRATLTGDNRPGGFPGMYVELNVPEGDSALRSADVTLPRGVAAAIDNVQNPCPREQFDASACPAATRVGTATATVSITGEPITGDIYLVRVPGKALPGLGLSFSGRYAQGVLSTVQVDKENRLVTSFAAIPDLPLRRLVIEVASGPKSPLQLPKGACANGSAWDGAFVAQGGQKASAKTGLQCAAPAEVRLTDQRGLSVRLFDFGGRKLASIKATLPAGWQIDVRAAKRTVGHWVRMDGASASVAITKRSFTALAKKGAATSVRFKVQGDAVGPRTRDARRAKTGVVQIRLAFVDGTVQTQEVKAELR